MDKGMEWKAVICDMYTIFNGKIWKLCCIIVHHLAQSPTFVLKWKELSVLSQNDGPIIHLLHVLLSSPHHSPWLSFTEGVGRA